MTPTDLRQRVNLMIGLDREIKEKTSLLNSLKAEIITAAPREETDENWEKTPGGGCSWRIDADLGIARVTFPADRLKDKIDPHTKDGEKLWRRLTPRQVAALFELVTIWRPVASFRETLVEVIPDGRERKAVLRACESDSKPTVSFETATA